MESQKRYISFKQHITESIGLTKPTPKNIVTDTKPKLGLGLGSYKKFIPTPEPDNPIQKFMKVSCVTLSLELMNCIGLHNSTQFA